MNQYEIFQMGIFVADIDHIPIKLDFGIPTEVCYKTFVCINDYRRIYTTCMILGMVKKS